jgi:hypothetical protein
MTWPPRIGEPLPRATEALGVREKLINYSLDIAHESGGSKARGFERILGIAISHVDYVEEAILTAVLTAPVQTVRDNRPHGFNCLVEFPLSGIGRKATRVVGLRTTWELANATAPPRLITAYLRP